MTARPRSFDPEPDAWRRRLLLGLIVLAALLGGFLGILDPIQF